MGSSVQINKLNRINKSTSGYVSLSLLPRLKKNMTKQLIYIAFVRIYRPSRAQSEEF